MVLAVLGCVAGLTVWVTAADVLAVKLESPEYCAVIVLAPTGSAVVASEALPLASSVAVPSVVEPSRNVTVPVGGRRCRG